MSNGLVQHLTGAAATVGNLVSPEIILMDGTSATAPTNSSLMGAPQRCGRPFPLLPEILNIPKGDSGTGR